MVYSAEILKHMSSRSDSCQQPAAPKTTQYVWKGQENGLAKICELNLRRT